MLGEMQRVLENDPRIAYALIFGSGARGTPRPDSDLDVAVGLSADAHLDLLSLGKLTSEMEAVTGRAVDLVLLDEAPPPLAYRAFREGRLLFERDHRALVARKARAILEYLDFRPIEERCAAGVLRVAARGR